MIEDCDFDTGDDCIAIKSGRDEDGRYWNIPSENIIVRHCRMKDGHAGVAIGSEVTEDAVTYGWKIVPWTVLNSTVLSV